MANLALKCLCALVVISLLWPPHGKATAAVAEEKLKALFIVRIISYIHWPHGATRRRIAVLGSDNLLRELKSLAAERLESGAVTHMVQDADSASDAAQAEVLYVAPSHLRAVRGGVNQIRGRPVLVIADQVDGLEQGATISFLLIERRLLFGVSLSAAQEAGLRVSSDLLSIAHRVRGSTSACDRSSCTHHNNTTTGAVAP